MDKENLIQEILSIYKNNELTRINKTKNFDSRMKKMQFLTQDLYDMRQAYNKRTLLDLQEIFNRISYEPSQQDINNNCIL